VVTQSDRVRDVLAAVDTRPRALSRTVFPLSGAVVSRLVRAAVSVVPHVRAAGEPRMDLG